MLFFILLAGGCLVFSSLYLLNIFQIEGYKVLPNRKYLDFYKPFFMIVTVAFCILFAMYSCVVSTGKYVFEFLGLLFIFALINIYAYKIYKEPRKVPLKFTPRMTRLLVAIGAYGVLFEWLCVFLGTKIFIQDIQMTYLLIAIPFYLLPLIIVLAFFTTKPIEDFIAKKYVKTATELLAKREDLIKIGITGSYGKTSVKNILARMLSEKYEVLATPLSYNTPMGICKSLSELKDETQVFIAEMGARYVGDIKELCDIVNPSYGILTGIAPQHIKTFGSIENVCKTKYELIENLRGDAFAVFNGDNEYTKEMFNNTLDIEKAIASLEIGHCVVSDIKTTASGSDFNLKINGESVFCSTILIGRHNILNIAMASAMAHKLGVSLTQIAHSICGLQPIAHRLEVDKNSRGITIIDDCYNSNTEGFKSALETLMLFKGRKIIVTPGIVEAGAESEKINAELGREIAKVCDRAILIGTNAEDIANGAIDGGMDNNNLIFCETLAQAQSQFQDILKSGDVVLIENDLPDNY